MLPLFWLGKVQVKLCVNKKACHPSTPARKQGQRTITVFYSSTAQLALERERESALERERERALERERERARESARERARESERERALES